ncbi:MAG TPA: sigma-70 family RNA polymerase sigma factor [Planctomycetota bacterium]|nr:sigma-70 family RNA polymerase sigma factor [Planctomycetota bacterium]
MEERELIRNAQNGDREAYGQLVALYQARLRAFVARYVTRPDDVFDIVQEGFIDAMQHLDRFDPAKDFGPWLRAICRNRMLNHFRSAKVRQTAAAALVDEALQSTWGAMEDDLEEGVERVAALRRCIDKLEKTQRELVEQRYRQEIPLNDLARKVGRSAAALSMALFRIRAALEKCMEQHLEHA